MVMVVVVVVVTTATTTMIIHGILVRCTCSLEWVSRLLYMSGVLKYLYMDYTAVYKGRPLRFPVRLAI